MQNRIREYMRALGIKPKQMATALGMTTSGVAQLADKPMPTYETFVKFARVMSIPAWKLMLTDEEIAEIQRAGAAYDSADHFCRCPACGTRLRLTSVPDSPSA